MHNLHGGDAPMREYNGTTTPKGYIFVDRQYGPDIALEYETVADALQAMESGEDWDVEAIAEEDCLDMWVPDDEYPNLDGREVWSWPK